MKVIIGIVILASLVLGGVYFFGGYSTFDPDKQGNDARAKITPGMTWQQVLSVAGDNPKYQGISLMKEGKLQVEKTGPEVEFNRSKLAGRINNGEVPSGFNLVYRFSERVAYAVHFDKTGKVIGIDDVPTMADLLQTR